MVGNDISDADWSCFIEGENMVWHSGDIRSQLPFCCVLGYIRMSFGSLNRSFHVIGVSHRGAPKPLGCPPQSASEDSCCSDRNRSEGVMINSIANPSPPSEQELDKRSINGLILIVGIGWAVWIAFGSKRKNFGTNDDRDNQRGDQKDQ